MKLQIPTQLDDIKESINHEQTMTSFNLNKGVSAERARITLRQDNDRSLSPSIHMSPTQSRAASMLQEGKDTI